MLVLEEADDETLVAAAQELAPLLTPPSPTLAPSAAFTELYTRYLPRIYRFCCNRLGDLEAAEDATSEVFLHAFAHLPDYRSGSFGAWLYPKGSYPGRRWDTRSPTPTARGTRF